MRLHQKRFLEVYAAIQALPSKDRPVHVMTMLALCLGHLDWNTNLVGLTRDEFAELMGVPAKRVTDVAAVLERLGAITREPVLINGRKSVWVQYRVAEDLAGKGKQPVRKPSNSNVVPLRQTA